MSKVYSRLDRYEKNYQKSSLPRFLEFLNVFPLKLLKNEADKLPVQMA